MANRFGKFLNIVQNQTVAVAAIVIVLMLLLPVTGFVLNVLMVANIAVASIVLLVVLSTPKASDFSSFPRIILLTTIYGLALNVCSTRFILTNGYVGFDRFDGDMIKGFASIVAGNGELVTGMVIFIILIIIQTVVITKGATRVSEVAARFALDSMNSKMFAVDSELNSGSITDEQAREKKASIQRESDFYSAMDGATKFVSGNVKAGIFITVINLVAGIIIARIRHSMPITGVGGALDTYSKLTIGDGLLSQLPSLLLAVATGILVTGSNSEELLGDQLKKQLSVSGYVYIIAGAILVLMSFIFHDSMALVLTLLIIGSGLGFLGFRLLSREKATFAKKLADEQAAKAKTQTGSSPEEVSPVVPLDPLSLELGYALIPLVDKEKGAELLERVTRIRREAALDLGLVVPRIRIIDNMTLDPNEYSFKIRGIEAGRSKIKIGYYLCMNTGGVVEEMQGERTTEPAFGMPAIWVSEEDRAEAERRGYAVIDPPTIIATHLTEIIRGHAAEILGRQEVAAILNKIKETNPVVVDEVLSGDNRYTYGQIEKVLQGLLREQVSIRNIVVILETLANFAMLPHTSGLLVEKVREALGLQICLQYVDSDRKLSVLKLSQSASEKILQHAVTPKDGGEPFVAFDPVDDRKWISAVSSAITQVRERNFLPIILCASEVRALVRSSIDRDIPGAVVLSITEVMAAGHNVSLEILGEIDVQ
ncbi:MAG: flagellar biosynthesis protein FlhA [Treponema sp.]|nr:flagellar biosynthesis protein FlhA [Treponema sp.]